ncbi:hypothetical protein [Actinomadura sp. 3N508]|uniref:hypothetical protein n=1 Tax=Actinomadura sp. 3N508 TaxID=3375153 RepID=UPI0037A3AB11
MVAADEARATVAAAAYMEAADVVGAEAGAMEMAARGVKAPVDEAGALQVAADVVVRTPAGG